MNWKRRYSVYMKMQETHLMTTGLMPCMQNQRVLGKPSTSYLFTLETFHNDHHPPALRRQNQPDMNTYHLKRIRNKYQYKFIDGVLHVFNHKARRYKEYKHCWEFVSNYIESTTGMLSSLNYDIRIRTRMKQREYYYAKNRLTQTELKIKEI